MAITVNEEHNNRKNREAEPTVGDYPVNFVGGRKLVVRFLFVAALDDRGYVDVAFIGDNGSRRRRQAPFRRLECPVQCETSRRWARFSCASTLSSRSKILMAYQRCCSSGMLCTSSLFNMSDRVFHRAGKGVLRNGLRHFLPRRWRPPPLP